MTARASVPWLRLVREPNASARLGTPAIQRPSDAARILRQRTEGETVEVFLVLMLDTANQVTAAIEIARGILNSCLVHPREVFRAAILHGAASIIIGHNHPSGNLTPSSDDRAIDQQLVEAGKLLGIPVMDSLIVSAQGYYSTGEGGTQI